MSDESFFEHLPAEIIENIIRQASKKPRHKYWPSFIDIKTLQSLLHGNTSLRSALSSQIRSVSFLKSKYDDGFNSLLVHPKVENGSFFIDSEYGVLYSRWFELVRELNICYGATRSGSVLSILNKAGHNFNSLRKLQVLDKTEASLLDALLKSHGSQLETLSVWLFTSFSHAASIAKNCNNLRELEITGLKHNVPELWSKLGKTLEKLSVTFRRPVQPKEIIDDVQFHCRNLKRISIAGGHFHIEDEALISFYSSYGVSLEFANFKELGPFACSKIVEACPNVRCAAGNRTEMVEQMKSLGSHLSEFLVRPSPPESIGSFQEASEMCSDITIINGMELYGWSPDHFKALFTKQRHSLRSFHWTSSWPCVQGDVFFFDVVGTIARQSGNLREFSLSLDVTNSNIFDELAEKNQHLEYVHVTFLGSEDSDINTSEAVEILGGSLRSFKNCNQLKEFRISHEGGVWYSNLFSEKIPEIENECVPYRTKSTYIKVGEHDYLA